MTRRRSPPDDLGLRAEAVAAQALTLAGMTILARRLRTRGGELDLVARERDALVAIEVKGRSRADAPERAVDDRRLLRLRKALAPLAPRLAPRARWLRVDVVAVCWPRSGAPQIAHFRGTAFPVP